MRVVPRQGIPFVGIPTARRLREWRLWYLRWAMLLIGVLLLAIIHAPPLGLPGAALAVGTFDNLLRLLLVRQGDEARLRSFGWALFLLDAGLLVVGVFPLLRQGRHPGQLLLLAIFVEATLRLQGERPSVATLWLAGIALALVGFELFGLKFHEEWDDAVLWSGSFVVAGVWGAIRTSQAWDDERHAILLAPEGPPIPPPAPSPAASLDPPAAQPGAKTLTRQQRAILRLVAAGMSTCEIAEQLHLSPETIRSHLYQVSRKLDVHSRDEAVQRAREWGLLE